MKLDTVIFDMDGLLIDSEPIWQEAGTAMLNRFAVSLTDEQYHFSMGLRSSEWFEHWFTHFGIDMKNVSKAISFTESFAFDRIQKEGKPLPGVHYIMSFFKERNFKIGLASSSPVGLIEAVIDKLQIRSYIGAATSANLLDFGKPHPQVFLNCAVQLESSPVNCICFEDSFNGMIAAKAARMKCVIVPAPYLYHEGRWDAADIKLNSLLNFNEQSLIRLES